jgi:transposase
VDECGVENYMARKRARSPRGKRVVVSRPGKRFKRINVVAGQCGSEVIGETQYAWTTDSRWFMVWFEWYLCPFLRPGSVIIMDNARFHNKPQLEQIAHFYGYRILWLPPYSPDKNPIEQLWANLKNWLCNWSHLYTSIQEAIRDYFEKE